MHNMFHAWCRNKSGLFVKDFQAAVYFRPIAIPARAGPGCAKSAAGLVTMYAHHNDLLAPVLSGRMGNRMLAVLLLVCACVVAHAEGHQSPYLAATGESLQFMGNSCSFRYYPAKAANCSSCFAFVKLGALSELDAYGQPIMSHVLPDLSKMTPEVTSGARSSPHVRGHGSPRPPAAHTLLTADLVFVYGARYVRFAVARTSLDVATVCAGHHACCRCLCGVGQNRKRQVACLFHL